MPVVFLSLGSNVNRDDNIRSGLHALQEQFGKLQLSPVYQSEAVGFDGDDFYNLVARIETHLDVATLLATLRRIEEQHGRLRGGPKFSSRTLDIDILTYDNKVGTESGVELPRDEILKHAFVLKPLVDLAPEQLHPAEKKTFAALLDERPFHGQKIWQVDVKWP